LKTPWERNRWVILSPFVLEALSFYIVMPFVPLFVQELGVADPSRVPLWSVAIFGMGVIGLLAVQLARLDGALWIDAVDPLPHRRDLAEKFGADRTLDPGDCDVAREIKTASPQRGADVAGAAVF